MGLKTIQAQFAAEKKEIDSTIGAFVLQAKAINAKLIEYKAKLDALNNMSMELGRHVMETHQAAEALNTQGVVQFAEVKKLLILAAEHGNPHPISLDEITGLEKHMQDQVKQDMDRKMEAYTDKLVASWPTEIKPGMTFKRKGGDVLEILGVPAPGAKGADAIQYKVRHLKSYWTNAVYDSTMFRTDLSVQKGWKFIKT